MSELEKKDIGHEDVHMSDIEFVSQNEVDEIMKKYDRESNTRIWEGTPGMVVRYALAAFSVFMIWMNLFATWDERIRRSIFVGLLILFTFIIYPLRKGKPGKPNSMPWYDIVLALVGSSCFFYFALNLKEITAMATRITQPLIVIGIIGTLVLFEATRRVVGPPILCVAAIFLLYAFADADMSLRGVVYNLFYTTTGILGVPIGVCSTFIFLFVLFGAYLESTGIGDFFIQLANMVCGWASGGPAKVAVIASALEGMVSGSSVANTVGSGSITIPMMKKTGYPPEFAGAVEATASTGGQIMPPVMGAAAFLMAEMVGVPYATIAVKAIFPAILYFTGVFIMVHFKAQREGLRGIPRNELPKPREVLPKLYLIIPLVMLIFMMGQGYTMSRAAIIATVACIVVALFNKDNRMNYDKFVRGLENGAKNALSVGCACGVAGIVAGVVTMTGLGAVFIKIITRVAGDNLFLALLMTAVCCILMGMGVPTTANYVIMGTTCAPILISGMGLEPLVAHMFVFYYGIIADITPPIALAATAGAAIAKTKPIPTAFQALRLAIAAFIVPFIFAMDPAMLFIGESVTILHVAMIIATALLGMFMLGAGLIGCMKHPLSMPVRAAFAVIGLLCVLPDLLPSLIGTALAVVAIVWQYVLLARKSNVRAA